MPSIVNGKGRMVEEFCAGNRTGFINFLLLPPPFRFDDVASVGPGWVRREGCCRRERPGVGNLLIFRSTLLFVSFSFIVPKIYCLCLKPTPFDAPESVEYASIYYQIISF